MSYAELHCISNFSFLRGASRPEELVTRAAELNYQAIAITDECSLAGVVKAHAACQLLKLKKQSIKLIIGSEFAMEEQGKLVALAHNTLSYQALSAFISLCRRRSKKGEYHFLISDIHLHLQHCLLIYLPARVSQAHQTSTRIDIDPVLNEQLQQCSNLWIGYQRALLEDDHFHFQRAHKIADQFNRPMLACGNVQMHCHSRKPLHDTLHAIKHHDRVQDMGTSIYKNSENYLRPIVELESLYPQALLQESLHVAEQCQFSLSSLRYQYPKEVVPPGYSPINYLTQLVQHGGKQRWQGVIPRDMQQQIDKELALIAELRYEYYFLTVYDIVSFARQQNILCQGRGSAANSVVCYCLFITEVDPNQTAVLFERFISKERNEPPDIDVDFENSRREEVIQYIYKKYSRERAALAATVITYRTRSAIRDVGKALGFSEQVTNKLSRSLGWWHNTDELAERLKEMGIATEPAIRNGSGNKQNNAEKNPIATLFLLLVKEILGFPRHLSQHVGGFIISDEPISRLVPVENAAMPERTIIQWDKDDIETLGLLKVDILALGMLSAIQKMLTLINSYSEKPVNLASIPKQEPNTFNMLCNGDSIGVFQVESRAQLSMLPRLKPRTFYDLVIQVAIVRPGPIQGNMVHPYLRRRDGIEPVHYENDDLREVLSRTLGIPIFQEQVIKLAMVAAGFSGGEADQLRRAMASWGKNGNLLQFKEKLINGMLSRQYSLDFAERVFEQMKGFGSYGFPESHAASFALLVYISAWLKCHHPAAFYAGIINSQPMGFYSPSQLIQDAKRHGITILPIDVTTSDWDCTLDISKTTKEHKALRLGLRLIKGLSQEAATRLVQARQQGAYRSLLDMTRRAKLNQFDRCALIRANATASLSGHRHQSHWQNMAIKPFELDRQTDKSKHRDDYQLNDDIRLIAPSETQDIRADYSYTGFTLNKHPMLLLRKIAPFNQCKRAIDLQQLNHKRFVRVAGIVTGRQRPGTASGVIFLTLEDETGNVNVIVWRALQAQYRDTLLKSKLLLVKGVMEKKESVIHVIAGALFNYSEHLADYLLPSRDFH